MTLAVVVAVSLSLTIRDIRRGAGQAAVHAMELKAHLIPLDPVTRQYPFFLQSIGKGKFSLTNPNTNSVLILDTRNDPGHDMILSMARTQAIGSLARELRLSLTPGDVTRIDLSHLEIQK